MSPKLYYTCKRYLRQESEIEEIMADAFYMIFTKLDQLKETAAFEAWARRIAINLCLGNLRKNVSFNVSLDDVAPSQQPFTLWSSNMEERDILRLLQYLPEGCRTVFNLFVIEGYSHKEIAALLQISEGTSKSQLNFSRSKLKALVSQFYDLKEN